MTRKKSERGWPNEPLTEIVEDIHRTPPHSIEAEQGVLGSMLISPREIIAECVEKINENYFYVLAHQTVYLVLVELWNKGQGIDLLTFTQVLRDRNLLETVGGAGAITGLFTFVPTAANVTYYLEIVRDKYLLRQIIAACTESVRRAFEEQDEVYSLLDEVEEKILSVGKDRFAGEKTIKDHVATTLENIDKLYTSKGEIIGLKTGISDLDRKLRGIKPGELVVIAGYTSHGKAQPLNSKILTPFGWKFMSDISVGDKVLSLSGDDQIVTGVFPQGIKEVFRVTLSDGSAAECCSDHLWLTSERQERFYSNPAGSVKSLVDIMKTLTDYSGSPSHALPVTGIMQFNSDHKLPLHPYLLGLLLGDGGLTGNCALFTNTDADIISSLGKLLPISDMADQCLGDPITFRIKRRKRNNQKSSTLMEIIKLGLNVLSSKKFIPTEYLISSHIDRIDLLRGLMDTDGSVANGGTSAEFSSTSERLVNDVTFLTRSIGGIARKSKGRVTKCKYKGQVVCGAMSWRVNIRFLDAFCPFKCSRKIAGWNNVPGRKFSRRISSVIPVGKKETQCISVSGPSGIYITDDVIPTHNTSLALNIAEHVAIRDRIGVGILSLEMTGEELVHRLIQSHARINIEAESQRSTRDQAIAKIAKSAEIVMAAPIFIRDDSDISFLQARAIARKMCHDHKIGAIIADYAQLFTADGKKESTKATELSDGTMSFKRMAKELGIVVFLLSQLNDNGQLFDSRAIGFHADKVLQIRQEGDRSFIDIKKNRNGERGTVETAWLKSITRFENLARNIA